MTSPVTWLTTEEAAAYLKTKPETLRSWRKLESQGKPSPIPSHKIGRLVRYIQEEIDQSLTERAA